MTSYILTLRDKPEGVFSVIDKITGEHIIPIFEDEDDAERYAIQLTETSLNIDLQILEIDKDFIVTACEERDQKYAIITIDDFIIPPQDIS
jgi:hypothetical protein